MLRHLGPIAACACILASVGCDPPTAPTPPSPKALVTVELGGRVVNADTGGPVGNVRVSVDGIGFRGPAPAGWEWGVYPKDDTATSGADGTFTLPLNLPVSWRSVSLELTAPGYDDTSRVYWPTTPADGPAIEMYPTLVIRPGESIEVRVKGIEECGGWGEWVECRRVLVAASPGDPVGLEVVPDDSSKPMGLSPDNWHIGSEAVRRLMVPPGSFPYVIGPGTARLTARR